MASDVAPATIGFIGLGMMGLPMARCLLSKGFSLVACDSAEAARAALAEDAPEGRLAFAPAPSGVAELCDLTLLMLPNSDIVARVAEGEGGLLPALREGAVVVDMGSSIPAETRRLAQVAAGRGASLIDAPVSGSVVKARAGTLAIMIGGDDAAFGTAEAALRAMGEKIIRTGPVGSAHAMKALNNYVYAVGLLAATEALQMADKLGLDLKVFTDVLNASSGRNVATETKLRQEIISGRYAGGFQLGLMRKDLETAGAIAAETGVDAEALALCRRVWDAALGELGPKADNTELHRYLAGTGGKATS